MSNRTLPSLNPLKARSTVALAVSLGAMLAPNLFGDIDPEAAGQTAGQVVDSVNEIVSVAGMVWFWFERRAPFARLSFSGD